MKCQTVRPYLIIDPLDAPNSMVMMLHAFENTVDSRLGSFGMTAGKLVPVENFYKEPEGHEKDQILSFTVNNRGTVSGSLNRALHIPVCIIF